MKQSSSRARLAARMLEIIIGLYFIAGAIPKVLDIDKFMVQMAAYKVIESPELLKWASLFTIFTEICLGMFLFLGVRLKGLTILVLQGLIVVFTVLITYAWLAHGLEDCGCFPVFKMSPPVSLVKNGLTLAGSMYILWVFYKEAVTARFQKKAKVLPECTEIRNAISGWAPLRIGAKIALSMLLAVGCMAYSGKTMDRGALVEDTPAAEGLFSQFELFMHEGYFNLADGVYVVVVMSTSCPECKASVPALNDLYMTADLPPMVALCYEEMPGELDMFKSITSPIFPTYSLGDRALLYFRLLEEESFRMVLIQDGRVIDSWDGFVPPLEELQDRTQQLAAAL